MSKMTLEQVRDEMEVFNRNGTSRLGVMHLRNWLDAIDAHLAQQPDLAAIREVIADMRMAKSPYCQAWADKLTAALPENAK